MSGNRVRVFSLQGDNEGLEVKGEKQVQAVGAKHKVSGLPCDIL